jgi:hypothetical protein
VKRARGGKISLICRARYRGFIYRFIYAQVRVIAELDLSLLGSEIEIGPAPRAWWTMRPIIQKFESIRRGEGNEEGAARRFTARREFRGSTVGFRVN